MAKVTITIDDTNPAIVAALGAGIVDTLANGKGYPTEVHNPNYTPAVGNPTIDDISKPQVLNTNGVASYPQIPNPDYVAEVGTPTIPNPETRAEYVGRKTLEEAILPYLTQEMAQKERLASIQKVKQIEKVIESVAVITTL